MLNLTNKKLLLNNLIPRIDIASKCDFDPNRLDFSGKSALEIALGIKRKDFEPKLLIKFETAHKNKIKYEDVKKLLRNFSLKDILKEINFNYEVNKNILSCALKLKEKSIKSFITDKDSILDNTSAFDYPDNEKRDIIAFTFNKNGNKIILGLINPLAFKRGFLSLKKELNLLSSSANFAIERWVEDYAITLQFCSLYNSVGIRAKNNINSLSTISKIQFSFAAEPIKLLKILFWKWIKEMEERKYLISFLKQILLQTILSYENNQWNFKIVFAIKNAIQLNIEPTKLSLRALEMKQTIYGG